MVAAIMGFRAWQITYPESGRAAVLNTSWDWLHFYARAGGQRQKPLTIAESELRSNLALLQALRSCLTRAELWVRADEAWEARGSE
jgi:hypothetical protein